MESQQIFKYIYDNVVAAHKMGSRPCVDKDEYQRISSNTGET